MLIAVHTYHFLAHYRSMQVAVYHSFKRMHHNHEKGYGQKDSSLPVFSTYECVNTSASICAILL